MKPNVSTLEPAFELAATGLFSTVTEIKLQSAREGYRYEQVQGPELAKQLMAAMTKASRRPNTRELAPPKKGAPSECPS